jgi:hypothetical protein
MRDTYLSVMQYLNDVRIGFLHDAGASSNPLRGDFRSATFDYFMWLDHYCDGFHDQWRDTLAEVHEITFEGVENGECPDILRFRAWFVLCLRSAWCSYCGAVDWHAYHEKVCETVDFCGAIQGTGAGEDIQHLLNAVAASFDVAEDQASITEPPAQTPASADVAVVRYSFKMLCVNDAVFPECEPISNIPIAIQ